MALRVLLCSTFVLASYADLQPEFDQDVYDDAVDQNYSERDDDRRFSVPEQFEALNATGGLPHLPHRFCGHTRSDWLFLAPVHVWGVWDALTSRPDLSAAHRACLLGF